MVHEVSETTTGESPPGLPGLHLGGAGCPRSRPVRTPRRPNDPDARSDGTDPPGSLRERHRRTACLSDLVSGCLFPSGPGTGTTPTLDNDEDGHQWSALYVEGDLREVGDLTR